MSYYFSVPGLMYLLPIMLVYGLVWYKRPLTAVLVTVFVMRAFFDVLTVTPIEYTVGAVLATAVAFSFVWGEWKWNAALFLIGCFLLMWVIRTKGVLYVGDPSGLANLFGMMAGWYIALFRGLFYGVRSFFAKKKTPHHLGDEA
jgi:hypothetical protein